MLAGVGALSRMEVRLPSCGQGIDNPNDPGGCFGTGEDVYFDVVLSDPYSRADKIEICNHGLATVDLSEMSIADCSEALLCP